jgi:hypothetical protein
VRTLICPCFQINSSVIAPPTKHCVFVGLFFVGPLILPVSTEPAALPDRKNPRRSGFSATFSRWSNKNDLRLRYRVPRLSGRPGLCPHTCLSVKTEGLTSKPRHDRRCLAVRLTWVLSPAAGMDFQPQTRTAAKPDIVLCSGGATARRPDVRDLRPLSPNPALEATFSKKRLIGRRAMYRQILSVPVANTTK